MKYSSPSESLGIVSRKAVSGISTSSSIGPTAAAMGLGSAEFKAAFFVIRVNATSASFMPAKRSTDSFASGSFVATCKGMTSDDLRRSAHRLQGEHGDSRPLLDMVGNASFVLLGEGSHGTHDFYAARAEITKRLIAEK